MLKQNKNLYIIGTTLFLLPCLLRVLLPHLSFLCTFLSLCGVCFWIYGVLSFCQKSKNRALAVTATVLKITAWVLIFAFLVSFIVIEAKIITAIKSDADECEYILVLGCGLRGKELTRTAVARAEAAIEYLEKYDKCKAILCGGQGKNELVTEARALYDYMAGRGIDKSRMILEEKSTDTTENIKFAKEFLPDVSDISVGVVTNDFHLYRSALIMKKAGFGNVYTISAPTPSVPLLHTSLFLREYFSILFEYLNI